VKANTAYDFLVFFLRVVRPRTGRGFRHRASKPTPGEISCRLSRRPRSRRYGLGGEGESPFCCTLELLMRISDIRATTVTVPLAAPLRHANGCQLGRFVRTIVEVETDNGLIGLARWGAEGVSRDSDPVDEALPVGTRSGSPGGDALPDRESTASLYNNRTQLVAAWSSPAWTFSGSLGRSCPPPSWGQAARPLALRVVLFFSISNHAPAKAR